MESQLHDSVASSPVGLPLARYSAEEKEALIQQRANQLLRSGQVRIDISDAHDLMHAREVLGRDSADLLCSLEKGHSRAQSQGSAEFCKTLSPARGLAGSMLSFSEELKMSPWACKAALRRLCDVYPSQQAWLDHCEECRTHNKDVFGGKPYVAYRICNRHETYYVRNNERITSLMEEIRAVKARRIVEQKDFDLKHLTLGSFPASGRRFGVSN